MLGTEGTGDSPTPGALVWMNRKEESREGSMAGIRLVEEALTTPQPGNDSAWLCHQFRDL